MSRHPRQVHPMQTIVRWGSLALIELRTDCHIGIVRLEAALAEHEKNGIEESVRKNTAELVSTLQAAMVALSDLEAENNLADYNATIEKAAHARTIGKLDEANKRIQQLTIEGQRMREAIEQLMK